MAAEPTLIPLCASEALVDGGPGVRFELLFRGERAPAFAVRHAGIAVAYLNRCAHVATELDWQPGQFFEPDAEFLICATHGALYDPATGACRGGACAGHGSLRPIVLVESEQRICWVEDAQAQSLPDSERPTDQR
jgi:nitrite reductase/ring-hydroxylating ferredoxin subunit